MKIFPYARNALTVKFDVRKYRRVEAVTGENVIPEKNINEANEGRGAHWRTDEVLIDREINEEEKNHPSSPVE